ncbi:MAG: tetratricopeptide repeat protein [Sphingomonadaceae bacterium]|nr:tetratricopeptide repeat protein [Sphingomonadaceae bacterium]
MKAFFCSMVLIAGSGGAAQAQQIGESEVAYPAKAIGYSALNEGDNQQAIDDLLQGHVSRHDPAFLLNLGQAYARSGRFAEAREMFRRAARKRDAVDLVLADGRVVNSKLAARQALATVQVGLAAR